MLVHELEPIFSDQSMILILGSFPSPLSRKVGFYYGHPQNRFWRVLAGVFKEDVPKSTEEKKNLLQRKKIALWDVIASCDIEGASDSSVRNAVPNDFDRIFSVSPVRAVFTTGQTAAKLYKKFTGEDSVCLPSPSPANCAVSLEQLIEKYSIILQYLQ